MNTEHPREDPGAQSHPAGSSEDQTTERLPEDLFGDRSQAPTAPLSEATTTPLSPPAAESGQTARPSSSSQPRGTSQDPISQQREPVPGDPAQAAPPVQPLQTAQPPAPRTTGARTSPIVWGALILAFCGYVLQRTLAPGTVDPAVWITATVLGLGLLLLCVGVAVAIRGRR